MLIELLRGRGVALDSDRIRCADGADAPPVWVQIAYEGEFRGHHAGLLTFDADLFAKVVANFRANPSYSEGAEPVIPYDYEHASEQMPTDGTIPLTGAPAPGWVLELEVRQGERGAELWALSRFNDSARSQIAAGEYRWTSVAIWRNAVDPETGTELGPVLTSVALTNHPFLKGMAPISLDPAANGPGSEAEQVAARAWTARQGLVHQGLGRALLRATGKADRTLVLEQWGDPESPEELLVAFRQLFDMPDHADWPAVAAVVERFAAMWRAGTLPATLEGTPPGAWMLDRMRRLIGGDILATPEEIFAQASEVLGGLVGNESTEPPAGGTPTRGPETMTVANRPALLTALSKVLDLPEDEHRIEQRVTALLKASEEGQKAQTALQQLQELFGAESTQDLIKRAAEEIKQAEEGRGLLESLGGIVSQNAEGEDAEAEEDAMAAATATAGGNEALRDRLKPALLAERKQCGFQWRSVNLADKAAIEAEGKRAAEAKKAWRERYGLGGDPGRAHLAQHLFASPNGNQTSPIVPGQVGGVQLSTRPGTVPVAPVPTPQGSPSQQGNPRLQLCSSMPGQNNTQRAIALLDAKVPQFKALDWGTKVHQAGQWLRGQVTFPEVQA